MATKRAEVDATLSLPGVSGVFTQDIEQYPDALGINDTPPAKQKPRKAKNQTKIKEPTPEPQPDPDEEAVKDTLRANGLNLDGFPVIKYDGAIRVTPPKNITQEQWDPYNEVLEMKNAVWDHKYKHWEVPL